MDLVVVTTVPTPPRSSSASLHAISRLSKDAITARDLTSVLHAAAATVAQALHLELIGILEIQVDGQTLLLRSGLGWQPGTVGVATIDTGPSSQEGFALARDETVIAEDLSTEERFRSSDLLRSHAAVSGLSAVLHGSERSFGVIDAHTCRRRAFDPEEVLVFELVAGILEAAIERLHVVDERATLRSRYEQLFESEVVAITRTTPDGRLLQSNRAAARMLGFESPEELLAQTPDVHSLYTKSVREPFLLSDGADEVVKPGEAELRRRDGSRLIVRGGATVVRGSNGEVAEYLALFVDVTERHRFEQEARESLAKYQAISELTSDFPCSIVVEPDGTSSFEWATESLERAVGYSIDEINALGGARALVHPDDMPLVLNEYGPALLSGAPVSGQLRFLTKTGASLCLEGHAQLHAEGSLRRILVGMSDVTRDHLQLEALRLNKQRLDRILALTPAVIFVIEGAAGWQPKFISGNVEDLFGYKQTRFSEGAAFWHEIVYPDDRDAPIALRAPIMEEGRYQSEYRFRHGDGSLRWLNEQLILVRTGDGEPPEIIGSWTDITESRATAEALQLADQQVQELLPQLAAAHQEERAHLSRELHDNLGQILTSASLFAKAASHDIPPERRELYDRVRSLIDDALASTRSLAWTLRRSEQSDLLEERLRQFVEEVDSGNSTRVHLEFRGHGRSVSVRVESVVFRIVQEAITNVLRHAQARHAWIIVTVTGTHVGVVIKDDGIGFDAGVTATGRKRAGLLGMEERARSLGGTLKIDSRPGWGTIVRVDLSGDETTT